MAHQNSDKVLQIQEQAVAELVKTAYKRYLRETIAAGKPEHPLLEEALKRIPREAFLPVQKTATSMLVTVSAKDGIDVPAFWAQMAKCVKKKALLGSGTYVLEQRSEGDQEPYGWHIHLYVKPHNHVSKSVMIQQVYQCFKLYVAGQNYIDVRPAADSVLPYLQGQKAEAKMAKVARDKVLRAGLGIPDSISY